MPILLLLSLALAPVSDLAGVYDTSYGRLELCRVGTRVYGFCAGKSALDSRRGTRLWGVQDGQRIKLSYSGAEGLGQVWFEVEPNGQLTGRWTESGAESGTEPREGAWAGTRIPDATAMSAFSGLWKTDHGYLRLSGSSAGLLGTYSSSTGSVLEGRVDAETLRCVFREDAGNGLAEFQLSADGSRLKGRWKLDGKADDEWEDWSGTRVEPVPGLVWLVILEARWEKTLREREYAFGDMLAEHFSMASARHVRVRRRSFHDSADFHRFASEVCFLAEPVLLVVSSHGTPEGILVHDEVIRPDQIATALRPADHLIALHLSGCSLMAGQVPVLIRSALGTDATLSISGYTTDVAWNASAIADYIYLSLILLHGLKPAAAVRQAHQLAPFTANEIQASAAFPALGLTLLD